MFVLSVDPVGPLRDVGHFGDRSIPENAGLLLRVVGLAFGASTGLGLIYEISREYAFDTNAAIPV